MEATFLSLKNVPCFSSALNPIDSSTRDNQGKKSEWKGQVIYNFLDQDS